ncbi:MAG TPA: FG-GAP-like repeat-containing protein [Bryobacteraceae bacterium]|jgi:uncharacterized protein (TIGR03437 family)|nr:FG-GAP-like repeat-containing protein [Bryobacteraceae bacterium]
MRPAWIPLLALSLPPLGRAQQPITFKNTQIAVDSGIQQVVAADVNGDGNADLIFLSQGKLSILIGNGDGTFRAPNQATALGYSTMVAADLNRDGKMDIAALGAQGSSTYIDTFLGAGDGTFAAPLRSPAPSPYHAMQGVPVAADVNGDGIPDLIGPGVIAIGAGDGTFSKTLTPCSGASGLNGSTSDSAVASFKGAGNLDLALVAAQMSGAGMFQLEVATAIACFANGAAAYSAGPNIFDNSGLALSYSPVTYLASAGDFNGDGHADVLIYSSAPPPNVFAYSVIFGDGNGGFKKPVSTGPYASSAGTANLYVTKPVVIDFNGDGKSDLVQIGGKGIEIFLSNGDGTFTNAAQIAVQNPVSIAVADFNNDGLPDIIATSPSSTTLLMNTSLQISSVVNSATFAAGPIAPGSLVSILGTGLGPVNGTLNNTASWPNSLAGVSVTFNGIAAPLSYVSARQINAQVPWEISGSANVLVNVNGASTPSFSAPTAAIAPGIFATSTGQALAYNLDGTLAGPVGPNSHPASAGDTLVVFANGLGPVTPSIADGVPSSGTLRTTGPTPVFIGNTPCQVLFSGLSPGMVGVNQLNVVVPDGVDGVVPLQINAGGVITSSQVTIAVQ